MFLLLFSFSASFHAVALYTFFFSLLNIIQRNQSYQFWRGQWYLEEEPTEKKKREKTIKIILSTELFLLLRLDEWKNFGTHAHFFFCSLYYSDPRQQVHETEKISTEKTGRTKNSIFMCGKFFFFFWCFFNFYGNFTPASCTFTKSCGNYAFSRSINHKQFRCVQHESINCWGNAEKFSLFFFSWGRG